MLLGVWYLFEILHTSSTLKNSKDVLKSGCFEKRLRWRAPIFFQMKEWYKVSCVKIFIFCSGIRRLVFIWNIAHLMHCEN